MQSKKNSGGDIGIDVDSAISSITEGDMKVDFAFGKGQLTKEQRLEHLIHHLIDDIELNKFRRVSW